ncbi:uncharacterized protein [Asterias amurensis]|uniref:uncharacterized protein n=1 Tax=Asterias amurensis TaxID=7602 RepID=UPI003AB70CC7
MRGASGARYAIAFKMAILSLVCLPQVPLRAAAGLSSSSSSSTTPEAVSRLTTANFKLSTTPSSIATTNTESPVLYRTENTNSETWTPSDSVVGPTTATEGDGGWFESPNPTTSPGPRPVTITEVAKTTDSGVAVVEKVCGVPVNQCDDIMVRKHGICGCSKILKTKKVNKSGLKKRSVLNKYRRPQLN